MSNKNSPIKYSEEFKKTIVTLYQSGKTYAEIKKEYKAVPKQKLRYGNLIQNNNIHLKGGYITIIRDN